MILHIVRSFAQVFSENTDNLFYIHLDVQLKFVGENNDILLNFHKIKVIHEDELNAEGKQIVVKSITEMYNDLNKSFYSISDNFVIENSDHMLLYTVDDFLAEHVRTKFTNVLGSSGKNLPLHPSELEDDDFLDDDD